MVNIDNLAVEIDAKETELLLEKMLSVRDELKSQFSGNILSTSGDLQFIPTPECGVSGNELRKRIIANFLSIFDSACVNECLKSIKFRVLSNKTVILLGENMNNYVIIHGFMDTSTKDEIVAKMQSIFVLRHKPVQSPDVLPLRQNQ